MRMAPKSIQGIFKCLFFMLLLNISDQKGLELVSGDLFKAEHEMVDSASICVNGVNSGNNEGIALSIEWLRKFAVGVLCSAKFESGMGAKFEKLAVHFCGQLENGINLEEGVNKSIMEVEEMEKIFSEERVNAMPKLDEKDILQKVGQIPFLNNKNKENVGKIVQYSIRGMDKLDAHIKGQKFTLAHPQNANMASRRRKRTDPRNSRSAAKCFAIFLTLFVAIKSTGFLAIGIISLSHHGHDGIGTASLAPSPSPSYHHYHHHHHHHPLSHGEAIAMLVAGAIGLFFSLLIMLLACCA